MTIIVNGETLETSAETLAELLEAKGLSETKAATAVNEAFVPAAKRAETKLQPGDRIEILTPMQGG